MPTVLIADQDQDSRTILSTALRAARLTVIATGDAENAREVASRRRIDVVVVNYPMLLTDGSTFTRAMRNDTRMRQVPIINVMSQVTPELLANAAADGVTHTLAKPTDIWTLLQLVRACLERQPDERTGA